MLVLWRKRPHELMCVQQNARMGYETVQSEERKIKVLQLKAVRIPGLIIRGIPSRFCLEKPASIKAL